MLNALYLAKTPQDLGVKNIKHLKHEYLLGLNGLIVKTLNI